MNLRKLAFGAALTLFTSVVNPNAATVESLFRKSNNTSPISFLSRTSAAERLEEAVKFEVNKQKYSVKRDKSSKFLVYDNKEEVVQDTDICTKAVFSKLVYDKDMKELRDMPLKPLYSTYFKAGELAQYAKGVVAKIFLGGSENLLKNAKLGPKAALLATLADLTKEQILDISKKIIKHPEALSIDIAISSYKQGRSLWGKCRRIEKNVERTGTLSYSLADLFLYSWFQGNTLMALSNDLVNDINSSKYDSSLDESLLNVVFDLMGNDLRSLRKERILESINPYLDKSLGQYEPYQKFSKRMKERILSYIKRKLELDKEARNLTLISNETPSAEPKSNLTTYYSKDLESSLAKISSYKSLSKGRYLVDFDIIIRPEGTLEIIAGTEIHFGRRGGIITYGILRAIGKENEKIIFTAKDNGWKNIAIIGEQASKTMLEYCKITKGAGRKGININDANGKAIDFKRVRSSEFLGGGLLIIDSSPLLLKNTINNNVSESGGGIFLYKSNSEIKGNFVSNNISDSGGGINIYLSNPSIADNTISNNKSGHGGGIYIEESNSSIRGNIISGNHGKTAGGGLYIVVFNGFLEKNTIQNNSSYGGGGIFIAESKPTFTGNTIINNKADYGGGIQAHLSTLKFNENTVQNNIANKSGGGIILDNSKCTGKDNKVKDNRPSN